MKSVCANVLLKILLTNWLLLRIVHECVRVMTTSYI